MQPTAFQVTAFQIGGPAAGGGLPDGVEGGWQFAGPNPRSPVAARQDFTLSQPIQLRGQDAFPPGFQGDNEDQFDLPRFGRPRQHEVGTSGPSLYAVTPAPFDLPVFPERFEARRVAHEVGSKAAPLYAFVTVPVVPPIWPERFRPRPFAHEAGKTSAAIYAVTFSPFVPVAWDNPQRRALRTTEAGTDSLALTYVAPTALAALPVSWPDIRPARFRLYEAGLGSQIVLVVTVDDCIVIAPPVSGAVITTGPALAAGATSAAGVSGGAVTAPNISATGSLTAPPVDPARIITVLPLPDC